MPTPTVNVASLKRAATEYNNVLRALPAYQFTEVASKLGLNVQIVNGEHVEISTRRKADLIRPYVAGLTPNQNAELIKFFESKLKPEVTYCSFVDNILNYKEKKVLSNAGEAVNLKSKQHPLELLILQSAVMSFNEDVVFNLFFGERADSGTTASAAFNGFFTKYDLLVTAGEIAASKGNLKTTGALAAPADGNDTKAYAALLGFIKSAHPLLRQGEVNLMISQDALVNARDAFRNKTKSFEYATTENMLERLRDDAMCPSLKVISHEALGTGSKLTLLKPGLLDLGMNDLSDKDYVQVRDPFEDPNMIQFWIEAAFDTRIKDVHQKLFQTNEQTATSVNFAGDY